MKNNYYCKFINYLVVTQFFVCLLVTGPLFSTDPQKFFKKNLQPCGIQKQIYKKTKSTRSQFHHRNWANLVKILDSLLPEEKIFIYREQLEKIDKNNSTSENCLLATNIPRVNIYISKSYACGLLILLKKKKQFLITFEPYLNKGRGRGMVGTHYKNIFLKLTPKNNSKVQLVKFTSRPYIVINAAQMLIKLHTGSPSLSITHDSQCSHFWEE